MGAQPQTVRVEHGCLGCGGCGTVLAVLVVAALAYEYWYVTVPLLAIAGVAAYVYREQIAANWSAESSAQPPPSPEGRWDLDPINPKRERWRQADGSWSDTVRPRQDWLPGERDEMR